MSQGEGAVVRRLPPGSHGIPVEVVARVQCERLVAAMTEVCAEKGYAGAAVAEVAKRAGVSSATFYKLFADKLDCLLATHRQLMGRLLDEVDRAQENSDASEETDRSAIRIVLGLLAADPPSARVLAIEILAGGPLAAKRYDAAVEALVPRLLGAGGEAQRTGPSSGRSRSNTSTPAQPGRPASATADWALVAGMLSLVGKLVMADEAARLPELEDELVTMLAGRR